jgi:hypothetical protein
MKGRPSSHNVIDQRDDVWHWMIPVDREGAAKILVPIRGMQSRLR